MSGAFGFVFGFCGLLLGLAVADVASDFSRAYDEYSTGDHGAHDAMTDFANHTLVLS